MRQTVTSLFPVVSQCPFNTNVHGYFFKLGAHKVVMSSQEFFRSTPCTSTISRSKMGVARVILGTLLSSTW